MSHATLPVLVASRRYTSPLGDLDLAASAQGLAGLWFTDQRHHPPRAVLPPATASRVLDETALRLDAYFAGDVHALSDLPVDLVGTPFQRAVWRALQAIAVGTTVTYGHLARGLGDPHAVRAVGAAVGRNPISLRVPCHRVIGHDGRLQGYAGGLDRKAALLRLEGVPTQHSETVERMNPVPPERPRASFTLHEGHCPQRPRDGPLDDAGPAEAPLGALLPARLR
jgi:methylated-DNA-[protein]-cysteine S-methyltransferase